MSAQKNEIDDALRAGSWHCAPLDEGLVFDFESRQSQFSLPRNTTVCGDSLTFNYPRCHCGVLGLMLLAGVHEDERPALLNRPRQDFVSNRMTEGIAAPYVYKDLLVGYSIRSCRSSGGRAFDPYVANALRARPRSAVHDQIAAVWASTVAAAAAESHLSASPQATRIVRAGGVIQIGTVGRQL